MTVDFEQKPILQSNSSVWFNLWRNLLIRKKNFETLVDEFLKPEMEKKLPKVVKDSLKHGKLHEPIGRQNYIQYLKFLLKHDINLRETGLVNFGSQLALIV